MSLVQLVDNSRTDKNSLHNYLGLYDALLCKKKLSAKNILEIGIGHHAGSVKLWYDYFVNANIHGIDIMNLDGFENNLEHIKEFDRIQLFTSVDAYNGDYFILNILSRDIKYDLIVDDGPHTLESMIKFLTMYRYVLADDGIMIIEDIQSIDWIPILLQQIPDNLKKYVDVYDLRGISGRYDDIILVINKSKYVVN